MKQLIFLDLKGHLSRAPWNSRYKRFIYINKTRLHVRNAYQIKDHEQISDNRVRAGFFPWISFNFSHFESL